MPMEEIGWKSPEVLYREGIILRQIINDVITYCSNHVMNTIFRYSAIYSSMYTIDDLLFAYLTNTLLLLSF